MEMWVKIHSFKSPLALFCSYGFCRDSYPYDVDETHFNYFVLKPNGIECGKYDGGTNPIDQLFICDSEFPTTYLGKWDHWDIIVKGDHITILVNGKIVQDFDDISSFDTGRIGLYNEDARTSFDNITIIPLD